MSLFDRFKTPADEADVRNLQEKILELCHCGDDTYDIKKAKRLAILSASFFLALSNELNEDTAYMISTNSSYSEQGDRTRTNSVITMYNPKTGYRFEQLFDNMEMN